MAKPIIPRAPKSPPQTAAVKRSGYSFVASGEESEIAEITMYGEVCEKRPVDWWTGKEIEGDFIIQSEILEDLEKFSDKKEIRLRLHSLGGECNTAILIHNRLREMATKGVKITCIVDGVAMSAGSHIMCAADVVRASSDSLIMIHKSMTIAFGWYNANELRNLAESNDAYDKAIAAAYRRKTKKTEEELLALMSNETYMTGEEALKLGFVDELVEPENKVSIAASADRKTLFCNGRPLFFGAGRTAPEFIPTITGAPENSEGDVIKHQSDSTDGNQVSGGKLMASNLKELRAENSELASTVENEIRAELETKFAAERSEAVTKAVAEERQRIADIDEISGLYDDKTVREAKYGDKACSAQEMTFRAAKEAAKTGANFMAALKTDFGASGTENVGSAPAPVETKTTVDEDERRKQVDKDVDELFGDGKENA